MSDPSGNSFIPKRGPASHSKHGASGKRVYIITIACYTILFATILASGGMFLYTSYLQKQFNTEVANLDNEIKSFSVANLQKVLEYDSRLKQAKGRFDNSVSMVALFRALESATIDTVVLENLEIKREKDDKYNLVTTIGTDSFDSTIFQRGVYQRDKNIANVTITDVKTNLGIEKGDDTENKEANTAVNSASLVSFTATIDVPVTSIPHMPSSFVTSPVLEDDVPQIESEPSSDTESATTAGGSTNDNINNEE